MVLPVPAPPTPALLLVPAAVLLPVLAAVLLPVLAAVPLPVLPLPASTPASDDHVSVEIRFVTV